MSTLLSVVIEKDAEILEQLHAKEIKFELLQWPDEN